jgi:catechol 2,3-dioxygenase-like lactoylglutathione lyase family enzyme
MNEMVRPQIRQVVFDTTHPRASAEFWRSLLGLTYRAGHEPPAPGEDDPVGRDWLNLLTPSGTPCLAFQGVESLQRTSWPAPGVPQQLHLDLVVRDVDELNAARSRVVALGGKLLKDRSDDLEEPLHVYADLDGHTFCAFVLREA